VAGPDPGPRLLRELWEPRLVGGGRAEASGPVSPSYRVRVWIMIRVRVGIRVRVRVRVRITVRGWES
jgi:hypothetical protein